MNSYLLKNFPFLFATMNIAIYLLNFFPHFDIKIPIDRESAPTDNDIFDNALFLSNQKLAVHPF